MKNLKFYIYSFLLLTLLLNSSTLKNDALEIGNDDKTQIQVRGLTPATSYHSGQASKNSELLRRYQSSAKENTFLAPRQSDFTDQMKIDFNNLVAVFFAHDFEKLQRSKLRLVFSLLEVKFEPVDTRIQSSLARMIDRGVGQTNRVSSVLIRTVKDTNDQNYFEQIGFKMHGGDEAFSYARDVVSAGLVRSHPNFEVTQHDRYFAQYELERNITVKLAWSPPIERQDEGESIFTEPSPSNPGFVALDLFYGASH
jgi:hypothetical protein